ncbi:hypothetical protein [Microbacterium aurum]
MNSTTPASFDAMAPPVQHRWMSIVFMQGEEADDVLDMIDKDGPETAIQHLSRWDFGDETRDAALVNGYVYEEIAQSPADRVIRDVSSEYALTYNRQFGYVSLLRRFNPVVEHVRESVAPPARFGFERQRPVPHEPAATLNYTDDPESGVPAGGSVAGDGRWTPQRAVVTDVRGGPAAGAQSSATVRSLDRRSHARPLAYRCSHDLGH